MNKEKDDNHDRNLLAKKDSSPWEEENSSENRTDTYNDRDERENPGNFAQDRERANEAEHKGGRR